MRNILILSLAAVAGLSSAQTLNKYNCIDQINNVGGLISTPNFGVNQHFEAGFAAFSGFVADDCVTTAGFVDQMGVAMEFSNPATLNILDQAIKGWDIYASQSQATLAGGGGLAATVGYAGTKVSNVAAVANSRIFEIKGLNIAVTAGTTWFAMVPIMDFTPNGQTFILSNTTGVTPNGNNSQGFNPGNGFGLGTQVPVLTNAALGVNVVPEPASMVALGLGIAAFARRRRSSK